MDGDRAPVSRCMGVWLLVSIGCAVAVRWLTTDLTTDLTSLGGSFDALLPQLAAFALSGCALWFWWVTTWTALAAARGATWSVPGCPRAVQRAILAACGLALVGLGSPALADPASHPNPSIVAGLPLPQRATNDPLASTPHPITARHQAPDAARAPGRIVVRPGDTLWDLAAAELPSTADDAAITAAWHELYDANRDVLSDPDLIYPGTRLDRPHQEES